MSGETIVTSTTQVSKRVDQDICRRVLFEVNRDVLLHAVIRVCHAKKASSPHLEPVSPGIYRPSIARGPPGVCLLWEEALGYAWL